MPIDTNILVPQQDPSFAQNLASMANTREAIGRGNYYNADANWRNADAQRVNQQVADQQQEKMKQQVQQDALSKLTQSSMRPDGTPDYYKLSQGLYGIYDTDTAMAKHAQLKNDVTNQAMDDVRKQSIMPNGYDIDHDKMTKLIASDPRLGPEAAQSFQQQMQSSQEGDLKTKLAVQQHAANVFSGALIKNANGTTSVDPIAYQAAITKFHGVLGDNDLPPADPKAITTYKSMYQDPELALKQQKAGLEQQQATQTAKNQNATIGLGYAKLNQDKQLAENKQDASTDKTDFTKSKWTESQFQALEKRTNALNSSSRSALGQSGIANVRAARAMDVLTNKDIVQDPYAFDLVNTDVQGIMKGAAPTESQLKEKYSNMQSELASLWQKVTAQPTYVDQPGVKKQLVNIINGLKDIDNDVIDKNFWVAKVAFKKILDENPERAEEYFKALQGSKDVFPKTGTPESNAPHPDDNAAVQWAKSNPNDPRAAKILQLNGVK